MMPPTSDHTSLEDFYGSMLRCSPAILQMEPDTQALVREVFFAAAGATLALLFVDLKGEGDLAVRYEAAKAECQENVRMMEDQGG